MKRAFAFALLAGLCAPAGIVLAQAGPPMGGIQNQQGPAPQAAVAGNPGQQAAGGIFGQAPGGNIGGAGLGGNPGQGNPGQGNPGLGGNPGLAAGGAPAVGGAAIASQTTTQTTGQATVVSGQELSPIQTPWMINRVIHHVVSKEFEQQFGGSPLFAPMVGFNPVLPFPVPALGDLELVDVDMVSDMNGTSGPIYRVALKNNSHLPVIGVRVSLIAVLGRIDQSSPVITTVVKEIAAGGIATIDIPMPVAVMQLGPATAPVPFETLVASIDSFNELPETNEFNNVVTVVRTAIDVIETTQSTTTTTTALGEAAAVAAPAPGVAPAAPAPAAIEAAPMGEAAPAPMGEAAPMAAAGNSQDNALENLNLDNVENAAAPE
jgi:hypothetical protein